MSFFNKLFMKKENVSSTTKPEVSTEKVSVPDAEAILQNDLMIVQYAAYYTEYGDEIYRKTYLEKTEALGIPREEAIHIFNFECDVCKKFNKKYLLELNFVKLWFMGLRQPFFVRYPKTKDEICKETFFTIGELSKLIDEAEWHFWNSSERDLSDDVWQEIYDWRLQGKGGEYTVNTYLPAVCKKYSISMDSFKKLVNYYGSFLNKNKWG